MRTAHFFVFLLDLVSGTVHCDEEQQRQPDRPENDQDPTDGGNTVPVVRVAFYAIVRIHYSQVTEVPAHEAFKDFVRGPGVPVVGGAEVRKRTVLEQESLPVLAALLSHMTKTNKKMLPIASAFRSSFTFWMTKSCSEKLSASSEFIAA